MHDTYILLSDSDGRFYTGHTADLRQRLREHHHGRVQRTSSRQPVQLVYDAGCLSREAALRRERFLRSGKGKPAPAGGRRAAFLTSLSRNKLVRH